MDARWHYVVCLSTQHWMLWLPMWCQQHSLVHCSSHWSHSPLCILSEREVKNDTHLMHFWKLSKNRSQSRWMIILIPHNNSCALLVKDSITQSDFSFKWCCPTPLQLPIWKKNSFYPFIPKFILYRCSKDIYKHKHLDVIVSIRNYSQIS